MAWSVGHCQFCNYNRKDYSGNSCYCIFRVRHRRFSFLRFRYVRVWRWICDECQSDTEKQALRNKRKRNLDA